MEHNLSLEEKPTNRLPEIVGPDFKSHWVEGEYSNEAYHSDKSAISSSGIKVLLKRTPAHFKHNWMMSDSVDEEKESLRFGSLCHLALLEPAKFRSRYVISPDFGDMRSKTNRALRDDWLKDQGDSLIVTDKDYQRITGIIESILAHPKAAKALEGGSPEISGYFRDPVTGMKCRIRPDIYHFDKRVLIDFKTTRDAGKASFSRDIAEYMYDVSLAFYHDGIRAITGEEPLFDTLLAVEKEPPYAVSFLNVKPGTIERGRAWYQHGLSALKECLEKGMWPGHQRTEIEDIEVPGWAMRKELPMFDFGDEVL